MAIENPKFLELTSEAFIRDLKKALTIPPNVLAELAGKLNTDQGIKMEDEANLVEVWAKAGLPADILDAAVGVFKFIFSNIADGKATVDAALSELRQFCVARNITGLEERVDSIQRLITPTQTYLRLKKILPVAQGVGQNLESFSSAVELRAVFENKDSAEIFGYVPIAILHFEASGESEEKETAQFIVQVTEDGLDRLIAKLGKLKERMRSVKQDARAKLGYVHEFEEKSQ